jgi:hypothetical protein
MRRPPVRRRVLQGLALLPVLGWLPLRAQDQDAGPAVELALLRLARVEGELRLDFSARLTLSRAVEEALQRGVPLYFVAEVALYRRRWYWRDERIARVARRWRIAYQPLTGSWRVGLGALNQSYASLFEALGAVSGSAGWTIAALSQIDPDSRHYVEFSYRLDTAQLPSPMQIGLGGQPEWELSVERTLRVEP